MLKQRVLTVVLVAPFLIGAIISHWTWIFKIIVLLCLILAVLEFLSIVKIPSKERIFLLVFAAIHTSFVLFCPNFSSPHSSWILEEISLLFLLLSLFYCVFPMQTIDGAFSRLALSFVGIVYIGTFGAFIGLLRDRGGAEGAFWVFLTLSMTWFNDTFAYFAGRWFGKHKLSPQISPKKSVEGFLGGLLGSCVAFILLTTLYHMPIPVKMAIPFVMIVGILSPVGDLTESMMKRNFGVKDSGNIIPGHGGMLDRIDALLFVAPLVYLFSKILDIAR